AGNQQACVAHPRNAATITITGKHGTAKESLLFALLHDRLTCFIAVIVEANTVIWAIRWQLPHRMLPVPELCLQLLTLFGKTFPIGMERSPYLAILYRSAAQSPAPRTNDGWVEAGEIA